MKKPSMLTYSTSLIPFIENNDATRVQMASNQMMQALTLNNSEIPLVCTGYENLFEPLYTHRAKEKCEIVDMTLNNIILHNIESDNYEILDISWKYDIGLGVDENYTYNKDQIIASDSMTEEGILKCGKNLLTLITPYYGYNYEDAIIINEKIVSGENQIISYHMEKITIFVHQNEVMLSLKDDKYEPLLKIESEISNTKPYARIKEVDFGNLEGIFKESKDLKFNHERGIVYDIKIYPNYWNKSVREWDLFISSYLDNIDKTLETFVKMYGDKLSKDDILKYIYRNKLDIAKQAKTAKESRKFKYKKEKFPGVIIEMIVLYAKPLFVGDKFANRHGNKGVISIILPPEKMPQLEDGRTPDIIINPLGIISRMNIGQLKELYLATLIHDIRDLMMSYLEEGNIDKVIETILDIVSNLDNTETKWIYKQTKNHLDKIIENDDMDELVDTVINFYVIQPPFKSADFKTIKKLMNKYNTIVKHKVYDPVSKKYIKNMANNEGLLCGYMYWMKLMHMSWDKFSARSIGSYSYKTMQPIGGKKNKGGQRFGEMETWCLAAYDAMYTLDETITIKSDSITEKYKFIAKSIKGINVGDKKYIFNSSKKTETYNLLKNYLRVLGVELKDNNKS